MSQDNVELVRRLGQAFDAGGVEAVLQLYAEDVLIYPTGEWPDDEVYRGHDGVRRLWHAWSDHFEDFSFEQQEIRDVGDRVVTLGEWRGRLKNSAVPIREAWGVVTSDFRDGRIGEVRFFRSQRQALEAVGLAE
jgi:ketosteroid isomerase-like protein